jgi:hypothetical protein
MKRKLLVYLILVSQMLQGTPVPPSHSQNASGSSLQLRLDVAKERSAQGRWVSMEVTLTNTGTVDVVVADRLVPAVNAPAYFEILLSDDKGRLSPMETVVIEYSPRQRARWWSRLGAGRSKSISWRIGGKSHGFLRAPGKYKIQARYVCREPSEWDESLRTKEGEAISRAQVWTGELSSNPVWIEVLPGR